MLGADSLVSSDAEWDIVHGRCSTQEGLGSLSGLISEAADDSNILALNEGLGVLSAGQGLGWRSSLLLHPADDGLSSPASAVLHGLPILEELEGGIPADLKLLSKRGLLGGVNLSQLDRGVFLGQNTGGFSVLGSQG